jgi:hypothetical protein
MMRGSPPSDSDGERWLPCGSCASVTSPEFSLSSEYNPDLGVAVPGGKTALLLYCLRIPAGIVGDDGTRVVAEASNAQATLEHQDAKGEIMVNSTSSGCKYCQ